MTMTVVSFLRSSFLLVSCLALLGAFLTVTAFSPAAPQQRGAATPEPTAAFATVRTPPRLLSTKCFISSNDNHQDGVLTRRSAMQQSVAATLGVVSTFGTSALSPAQAAYIDPSTDMPRITDRVYLEVQIGDEPSLGRLEIGLFGDLMPRAVANFKDLCATNAYAGTTFYRVLSDYNIQGGAVGDVSGKTSTTPVWEPDNYNLRHNVAGLVSYARATPTGGADSRFFINIKDDAGWADSRYAAFGIVTGTGLKTVVQQVEKVKVQTPKNRPLIDVKITASGVL
mmetsp:Transcript_10077/g.20809  ORF Transcript_10077/g.20809 Transcript_10077/m.20809 type:complete len:283 (-) Transcript_10077:71-919(-)